MFGKNFADYIRFERWILTAVVAVFLIRLGLSFAGMPTSVVRWVSINLVLLVGLIYFSVAVYTTGFGSYKQLFGLLLIQNALAHFLIALALAFAVITATDNIYTAPEFFGGTSGRNIGHVWLTSLPLLSFQSSRGSSAPPSYLAQKKLSDERVLNTKVYFHLSRETFPPAKSRAPML